MKKVKVYGAGSIGVHLTQAARRMGWHVVIVDPSKEALDRMPNIYKTRYGAWDDAIVRSLPLDEPRGGFDVICIGTPPDVRLPLAFSALQEEPHILQLEKPLCTPGLEGLSSFLDAYEAQSKTLAFLGYDHAIAESVVYAASLVKAGFLGSVDSVDVAFREHWRGIFAAHPWLKGPEDTYLGFTERGGGASCEHSHALHLYLYFAELCNLGEIESQSAVVDMRTEGKAKYDAVFALTFKHASGRIGRVVQDVVTLPTQKRAYLQGSQGSIEILINGSPDGDIVRAYTGGSIEEKIFTKKRPDDFYREMVHFEEILEKKAEYKTSPLALLRGVEVMKILNVALQ
jgi:predicted dehydrogenase